MIKSNKSWQEQTEIIEISWVFQSFPVKIFLVKLKTLTSRAVRGKIKSEQIFTDGDKANRLL